MLQVTSDASLLPAAGPTPLNLNDFVSPAQNLVNGYNITEQTCFHKTTVSNLIVSLRALSTGYKGLTGLVQSSTTLIGRPDALGRADGRTENSYGSFIPSPSRCLG
jgi:hypothetical protein